MTNNITSFSFIVHNTHATIQITVLIVSSESARYLSDCRCNQKWWIELANYICKVGRLFTAGMSFQKWGEMVVLVVGARLQKWGEIVVGASFQKWGEMFLGRVVCNSFKLPHTVHVLTACMVEWSLLTWPNSTHMIGQRWIKSFLQLN